MFGSLSVVELAQSSAPSESTFWEGVTVDEEGMIQRIKYLPTALLPENLFNSAKATLDESLAEAQEEGDPIPNSHALERAANEISGVSLILMSALPPGRTPVVSAVVNRVGGIEVVGYFQGVSGRHIVRIDQNGACSRMTSTMWAR